MMKTVKALFLALLLCCGSAFALTPAQLATLKAAIAAETDPTLVALRQAGATGAMADWYSDVTSPAFIVWKTNVPINSVGDNFVGTELSGLTTANQTRLQTIALFSTSGVNPSLSDRRAFFDDVFSGASGTLTRPKLLALWKRTARRVEKVFATGAGTDASPATLTFEGGVRDSDIVQALSS